MSLLFFLKRIVAPSIEDRLAALEARVAALEACCDCVTPLWSELFGPAPTGHMLVIDRPVMLDIDAVAHGVEVVDGGELIFDPNASRLLEIDDQRPLCVMSGGKLTMRPANADVRHELRFVGVDESLFTAGGGMAHDSNPGLCVDSGVIDLRGAPKTAWTRATTALSAGATSCTVADATGWRVGDEIVIMPTEAATVSVHHNHYDRRIIAGVAGNVLTFAALTYPHPLNTSPSGVVIGAEVVNLTRNVLIAGTPTGRAQIMIMGDSPNLTLEHFEGAYLGPRKNIEGTIYTELVLGRYGLHWHLMGDGSRGTTVTGVSLHDLGSRAFVPHGSHGVTFTDCVAWDCFSEAYWWDIGTTDDESNDILYDRCFAGRVRYSQPNPGGRANAGFHLSAGLNLTARNCCVAALPGYIDTSAYHWPEGLNGDPHNVWNFHDNDAHNCQYHGIFVWQNDGNEHNIVRFRGWNNFYAGFLFGAYFNSYQAEDIEVWGNNTADVALKIQSRAGTGRLVELFGNGHIGLLLIMHHTSTIATAARPVVFTDLNIDAVVVAEGSLPTAHAGFEDFVNCGLSPSDVTITFMHPSSIIRIQEGASAWRITSTGTTSIPPFV